MQHVFWNHTKVLLAQEDEVIVGSVDVPLVTFFGRNNFLLQNGNYDLFTSRVTLRIGDCECFDVRWSKADLGRYIRDRLRIVGPEYFRIPGSLRRDETALGSALRFVTKNPESSSDLAEQLCLPVRVMEQGIAHAVATRERSTE